MKNFLALARPLSRVLMKVLPAFILFFIHHKNRYFVSLFLAQNGGAHKCCTSGDDVLIKYLPLVSVQQSFLGWCMLDRWQE